MHQARRLLKILQTASDYLWDGQGGSAELLPHFWRQPYQDNEFDCGLFAFETAVRASIDLPKLVEQMGVMSREEFQAERERRAAAA